ncbi:hypothetical protein [Sutterella megalosphaeroides]|uniref:Uncharacterized protein n=1 Tax=Sutterella megalosphaeroides TaxID=2494234 RepID=A0A2Z6IA11_9BURK|nr:hypothetical protein [Sutterella megalosphaeroides]BBF23353.1 hypothetical protein SUTMEG_12440 [Sutterella megalosphaeroides]
MTDDKFDDLNGIVDEEEETFEERMLDALGERSDWESDARPTIVSFQELTGVSLITVAEGF